MKVLIVSFYYFPEMGAAASRISNMAEGLLKEGAQVDVLTCLPNYPKGKIFEGYRNCLSKNETINGVNIYRYWTYATVSKNPIARFSGMLVFALAIWLFGLKTDLIRSYDRIVIQSPPLLIGFFAIVLFKGLYKKKVILNISDLWPISAIELGAVKRGSTYHKVLAWMENYVYKNTTAYQGQSQEIISHIETFGYEKPHFLYRNLQPHNQVDGEVLPIADREPLRLVYAGLLGVAQDILGLVQHINFKEIGAELHIYGGGNQAEEIEAWAKHHDCGVVCYGYKPKEEINKTLSSYHASIVPLAVAIKGAVPSKIFDLLPHGTPILFCGGGEGETIIKSHHLGLVSPPGHYEMLKTNICALKQMKEEEYLQLRQHCLLAAKGEFSFAEQMKKYHSFLTSISNSF